MRPGVRAGRSRRTPVGAAAVLAVALLTGCDGDGTAGTARGPVVPWPSSSVEVDGAGLVWALDGVVHLGDGAEIDTGLDTARFVVAGGGVLVADDGLHHVTAEGADTLAVDGVTDDDSLDVETGETTPLEDPGTVFDADPTVSPDGAWRIESPGGLRDVLLGADGTEVTPDTGSPRWNLEWWADQTTVVGYAVTGGGTGEQVGDDARVVLMGCTVPSGSCERHEETAGSTGVSFPAGARSVEPSSLVPRYVED